MSNEHQTTKMERWCAGIHNTLTSYDPDEANVDNLPKKDVFVQMVRDKPANVDIRYDYRHVDSFVEFSVCNLFEQMIHNIANHSSRLRVHLKGVKEEEKEVFKAYVKHLFDTKQSTTGTDIVFDNIFPNRGCRCCGVTLMGMQCKNRTNGTHTPGVLPGGCWMHAFSVRDYTQWLTTHHPDMWRIEAHAQLQQVVSLGNAIRYAFDSFKNVRNQRLKSVNDVFTSIPTHALCRWDKKAELDASLVSLNHAARQHDALMEACVEWARDTHEVCPICLEFVGMDKDGKEINVVRLACSHAICLGCYETHTRGKRKSASCPMCRWPIVGQLS